MAITMKKGFSVTGQIRAMQNIDKPKKGRPSKLQQHQTKFKWVKEASPFFKPMSEVEATPLNPITFKGGTFIGSKPGFQFTAKNVAAIFKSNVPAAQKAAVAKQVTDDDKRKRFLAQKQIAADQALADGDKIESSVIQYLEYIPNDDTVGNIVCGFGDDEATLRATYTYLNVPEILFNRWWEGQASCQTDDQGSMSGRHKKMWIKGKTPSLGAFFNQYIKGRFIYRKGTV